MEDKHGDAGVSVLHRMQAQANMLPDAGMAKLPAVAGIQKSIRTAAQSGGMAVLRGMIFGVSAMA